MHEPPKIAGPDDPQCQAITAQGQCKFAAPFQGANCILHNGIRHVKAANKASIYERLSTQYKERIRQMTDHSGHYSLNEEVGILRMMLETLLTDIQDDSSKTLRSIGQVAELITRIEKLVSAAMKAEKYIGGLLSRHQAQQMLQEAVDVIANEITDVVVLARIADKLTDLANKDYKDAQ